MNPRKMVGPKAPALKYDLLTAINLVGLHGSGADQVSMQRLSTLITARYNWRRDELSVGQRDMARMFSVTERTIKREVKRWTDSRVLVSTRQGVRGRVGAYRLNILELYRLSEPYWTAVGPDYAQRMTEFWSSETSTVVQLPTRAHDQVVGEPTSSWGAICARIRQTSPDKAANWLRQLVFIEDDGLTYKVGAKSAFVARYIETHLGAELCAAIHMELGTGRRLQISLDSEKLPLPLKPQDSSASRALEIR